MGFYINKLPTIFVKINTKYVRNRISYILFNEELIENNNKTRKES